MRRPALGLVVLTAALVLGSAGAAAAHPSDELLSQLYVTPTATGIAVDLELSPGVLIAPAFTALVDTDRDGTFSAAEIAAHARTVLAAVNVTVDGTPAPLSLSRVSYTDAGLTAAGGGLITLEAVAAVTAVPAVPPRAGRRSVSVTDAYRPVKTGVQGTVVLGSGQPVTVDGVQHSDGGRTTTFTYRPGGVAGAAGPARPAASGQSSGYLLGALRRPLSSVWALGVLLLASAALGALHALTPGHGKTLLAAYLIGERSTPRNAVALGAAVTITHTASVVLIGVVVLVAEQYVVPGLLVPALEVTAGLGVVVLGARLVLRRWRSSRSGPGHGHGHGHGHGDGHGHGHGHGHGPGHSPGPERAGLGSLVTMGVSGGIVPCPEALGVLLLAVGLHRTGLGLAMITAFSAGLAAVLVGLGLVLVTPRIGRWLRSRRPGAGRLGRFVPLGSALVVTCLGVAMVARGAGSVATG